VVLFVITSLGAAQRPDVPEPSTTQAPASSKATPSSKTTAAKPQVKPVSAAQADKPFQVGTASWYGKYFHGRKTASGETYDMFQFTAAHPDLPLGTTVKVTNLRNRRWVIVRVNDRGPVPKSRIIDLSYGAAQILGLRVEGLERVRLDVIPSEHVALAQARMTGLP